MNDLLRIEKLRPDHLLEGFECGRGELDRFLTRFAMTSQRSGSAQTYLAVSGDLVVGYYSLAVGEVAHEEVTDRLTKGQAGHSVPVMLLARLAVAVSCQGKGLGVGLLKDAMRRTLQAAEIAGIRAIAVHATDETAGGFYQHFGFIPSPSDPLHLFLLINDVRRISGF